MIDWERVDDLKNELGEEDFLELAEMFLEEVEEVLGCLRLSPEPSKIEAELHFLKGSAMNLGFEKLGDFCHMGEGLAATGNHGAIDLSRVFEIYAASRTEFLSRFSELRAVA